MTKFLFLFPYLFQVIKDREEAYANEGYILILIMEYSVQNQIMQEPNALRINSVKPPCRSEATHL